MASLSAEQIDQPSDFRYDMGFTAYPVQPQETLTNGGLSYHDYDWTQPTEPGNAARTLYHIPDGMDSSYSSYMGYPGVHHGEIGLMSTPTYIPASEMSFSTPLTHVPFQTHENYYHAAYSSVSPVSSSGSSGSVGTNGQKPKRKRVQSVVQRKAANVRERRRMFHLNEAFDELRKRLPAFNYEKRLSRIETLRLAMTYIAFMKDVSDGKEPDNVKLLEIQRKSEQFIDGQDASDVDLDE